MNAMQVFNYEEAAVEVLDMDGDLMFNATQVGYALGMSPSSVRSGIQTMEEGVDYMTLTNSMLTSSPNVHSTDIRTLANRGETFLTESGLYDLIMQSRKPGAKKFKRWVTREVLPSIRKTGSYGTPKTPKTFAEALRLAADQEEARAKAEEKLGEAQEILAVTAPKAIEYDHTMETFGAVPLAVVASILNHPFMGRNNLFKFLRNERVLKAEDNTPYSQYAHHFKVILKRCGHGSHDKPRPVTLAKASGVSYIIKKIVEVYGDWDSIPSKKDIEALVEEHTEHRLEE